MTTRLAAIFHHYNNVLGLRHQHDLPNVLAPFHVLMRFADLIEWKGAIDVGADPSFVYAAENLLSPQPDLLAFPTCGRGSNRTRPCSGSSNRPGCNAAFSRAL